ncbi:MAG: hypothetical protein K2X38_23450 [Gemmataceae bacterium]|nr:hypothetical protein [Gemmataceae bacterium]
MIALIALTEWLSDQEGGRKSIPAGSRFVIPAKFEAATDHHDVQSWSLVRPMQSRPAGSTEWIAEVSFLAPAAPQELLSDGAKFELMEGGRCVARGMVLPSQVVIPAPAVVAHPEQAAKR